MSMRPVSNELQELAQAGPRSNACPARLRFYTTHFRGLATDTTETGTVRNQTFNVGGLCVGIWVTARASTPGLPVDLNTVGISIQRQDESGLTVPNFVMAGVFSPEVSDRFWMRNFGYIISNNSTLLVRAYQVNTSPVDVDVTFALDQVGWS